MDPAVFGYIRVSQAEGASGLATQSRILTDHGLRDDRIFTDVASGRNMRRPAWQQLRGKLQPGGVVVPRLDRNLSEGLRTIAELHAQGIHIHIHSLVLQRRLARNSSRVPLFSISPDLRL